MTGFWRGIGLSNADRDRVEAVLEIGEELEESLQTASVSANTAEAARDAAMQAGNVFPTVAAGLDGTVVDDYFTVPGNTSSIALTLYRHRVGKVAVAVANYLGAGSVPASERRLTDMTKLSWWGASDLRYMDPQLIELAQELGVDYFSGANNGATLDSIWGEQGSRPMQVRFPANIIAATASNVQITWDNGVPRNAIRPRPVIIPELGVWGTIDSNATSLIWRRGGVVAGQTQPIPVTGAVDLISRNGIEWQNGVQIWCVGRNDIAYSVLSGHQVMFALMNAWNSLPTADRRVLVFGHWMPTDTGPNETLRTSLNELNQFYLTNFGERYLNVAAYLSSAQVWIDTGITPTATDLAQQALNNLAPSLGLPADNVHLNPTTNRAIVQNLIKPRLYALGWY